jgi:hypothetical protein
VTSGDLQPGARVDFTGFIILPLARLYYTAIFGLFSQSECEKRVNRRRHRSGRSPAFALFAVALEAPVADPHKVLAIDIDHRAHAGEAAVAGIAKG